MSFTCKRCGATSHNPNDEERRYCGACHVFEEQLMAVTRVSMITGTTHTLYLPITEVHLDLYNHGMLLQNAFPHLSAPEREFIKSGVTPQEWQQFMLPPDPEWHDLQEEDE